MTDEPDEHHPATLPDDELALPHFEDQLLAALATRQSQGAWRTNGTGRWQPDADTDDTVRWPVAAASVAGPVVDADADDAEVGTMTGTAWSFDEPRTTGRRRGWFRRRRLALVAVAASLVVAVVVVAGVMRNGDDGRPDVGTGGPSTSSTTRVEQQIVRAIEEAQRDNLVHTRNAGHMADEHWVDTTTSAERHYLPRTGTDRPLDRGRSTPPAPDEEPWSTPTVPTRDVDHCRREYADTQTPALTLGSALTTIQGELQQDLWRTDGTEEIDGRELLRLSPAADPRDIAEAAVDAAENGPTPTSSGSELVATVPSAAAVYVDADTLLPVSLDENDGTTTTIEYLPRTSENLALLVPPVPDGFTQVDAPATDDEIAQLGCV